MPSGFANAFGFRIADDAETNAAILCDFYSLDGALERRHAAGDGSAFEGRSCRARCGQNAMLVADDQLGVGSDIHHCDETFFVGQIDGQHAGRSICADVTANDRCSVDTSLRMDGQQAVQTGLHEAGRSPLTLTHLDFGDGAVGILADRVDALAEEEIAHRRVADDHHFVDGLWIDGKLFNRVALITGQRAHQQPARMFSVIRDTRHHLRAAEALGIFKGCIRDQLAAFKIDEPQNHGRRSQIHRDAVNGAGGALHFYAVDKNAIAAAGDGGIELERLMGNGKSQRVPLDAHLPAPHRMAADVAAGCGYEGLAGETEISLEMPLRLGER